MTSKLRLILLANIIAVWLLDASVWQVLAVDPVVSNVQAKQRKGSRLVDSTCDLAGPNLKYSFAS
jgi:hypothetical protein